MAGNYRDHRGNHKPGLVFKLVSLPLPSSFRAIGLQHFVPCHVVLDMQNVFE